MAKTPKSSQKERLFEEKLVPAKPGSGDLFDVSFGDDDSGPVECLGMTFENDQARRDYFLEKLREKLQDPEFRKIDGFPVGEDEDILAMSDPPYYTACPNPFVKDCISINSTSCDSTTTPYHREPFSSDVSEGKTDSLYRAHSYYTKVPHKAIMRYILHYTKPGDVVFDGFAGTGMTGIAGQLCGDRSEIEALGYRVDKMGAISSEQADEDGNTSWQPFSTVGVRQIILNDLSPAATFIASNYNIPVDAHRFKNEATRILKEVTDEIGWMFQTLHSDGKTIGRINYTVWSEVFSCSDCTGEIVFVREALDKDSGQVRDEFPCPHCSATSTKRTLVLSYEAVFDEALGSTVNLPKRIPVLINYSVGKVKYEKEPDANDLAVLDRIADLPFPTDVPINKMPDMQMRRVGRMKPAAITHIHHFFLARQLHSLSALWEKAAAYPEIRLRHFLLFFVEQAIWGMSVLNRYQPIMHGRLGGSQVNRALSGVFYVASQISEVSPWYNLEGKLSRLAKAFAHFQSTSGTVFTSTQDLASIVLPDNSLDYIFTDPPFGENIYYSDLNTLVESWHKVLTASTPEVIVDRVKGKTLLDYQHLMQDCFKVYHAALKPGRWMTVEFHNSKNSVWNTIQEALQHAGFVVADVRTLDKKQGSFQQVVSGNTVKRDLIISAYKPTHEFEERFRLRAGTEDGVWEFVSSHLSQLPVCVIKHGKLEPVAERQAYLLFDRMVAFHVERGVLVPLSTAEFHAGVEQRFVPRDNMYFLSEQVAQYDKRRTKVDEVVQLELFVNNEATAIQWLKRHLQDKPQAFQELQPQFMRELAGWEKHEKTLELSELLIQNFLCFDGDGQVPSQIHGYLSSNFHELRNLDKDDAKLVQKAKNRWYVPDPRKEGDLEKIRNRALMKEFEEYQAHKGKLTKVRTEALRAGFQDCYGKQDYQAIVAIGRRVKESIIQEDMRLLMYYDNAVMLTGE